MNFLEERGLGAPLNPFQLKLANEYLSLKDWRPQEGPRFTLEPSIQ